jgi:hypothetical protein
MIIKNLPRIIQFVTAAICLLSCYAGSQTNVLAGEERQIASVVQRGNFAYVYDAKGSQFLTLSAGDGVVGFTSTTVSIRRGNFIYIYNTKGSQTSVIPAGN